MRIPFLFLFLSFVLFGSTTAQALVVGREGVTYSIKEQDFLNVIEARAANINMAELEKTIQESLKEQTYSFRLQDGVQNIPPATSGSQYRVDLTYTVPQDIKDLHGNIIYPEGHKVNPLKVMADRGMNYPFMLLILNGDREAEIEWFLQSQFNNPRVKVLITNGYPYKLAEQLKRPVYQLTKLIMTRFRIQATPSLVFWPQKTDYLAVRTIAVHETKPENTHAEVQP